MNQGAKLLLGVLAIGGIGALIFASEKKANAAPGGPPTLPPVLPPSPGQPVIPPSNGTVIVPPLPPLPPLPGVPEPGPGAPPPLVAPLPSVLPGIVPGPGGTTVTLPGIGTFNPATGNVFGPNGVIVGTFNPTTGQFTPTTNPNSSVTLPNGQQQGTGLQIPTGPPVAVLPPLPPVPTQTLPGLTITPGPAPTPAEPPASPAEQSSSIAPDTLTVLTSMLAQEHSPSWRVIPEPTLVPWQQARGLTGDGDFGTGTALRMAQEVGTIPIIRGWPKGTVKTGPQLPAYRKALLALAATAPEPRKSQLIAAAAREQGQGYGTPETPIATLITLQDG